MDAELLTPEGGSNALKEEWKGSYESNLGAAKKAIAKWGSEELLEWGEKTGVFNFPPLVKFLSKIGQDTLKEESVPKNDANHRLIDKDAAQERLSQIMNNKDHPYHSKQKTGHQQSVEEVLHLNEIIHGSDVYSVVG
jgi:hypothetical protein